MTSNLNIILYSEGVTYCERMISYFYEVSLENSSFTGNWLSQARVLCYSSFILEFTFAYIQYYLYTESFYLKVDLNLDRTAIVCENENYCENLAN